MVNEDSIESFFELLKSFGERVFLYENGEIYTYKDLFSLIEKYRDLLVEKNISKSVVIGLHGDYSYHAIAFFFSSNCAKACYCAFGESFKRNYK